VTWSKLLCELSKSPCREVILSLPGVSRRCRYRNYAWARYQRDVSGRWAFRTETALAAGRRASLPC
jgi:hypothetical protein